MDAVPPPLPSDPKPPFRLPWYAWLVWFLGVAVLIWLGLQRAPGRALTPEETGRLVGQVTASLLFPLLLGWAGWRIAGRSRIAGTVIFCAVVVAAVMGQFSLGRLQTQLARMRALEAQRKIEQLQREAVKNGKPLDSEAIRAEQRKAAAARQEMARHTIGNDRALLEADEAVNVGLREAKAGYDAAMQELHAEKFFQLSRLESREQIPAERERVRAFAKANKIFQDKLAMTTFDFSRELRARNLSEAAVQAAVATYRANTTAKLGPIGRIRAADGELAEVMLEFLDFADEHFGSWRYTDENTRVIFNDSKALTRYNALMQHLKQVQARQSAAQRELVGAKGPGK